MKTVLLSLLVEVRAAIGSFTGVAARADMALETLR